MSVEVQVWSGTCLLCFYDPHWSFAITFAIICICQIINSLQIHSCLQGKNKLRQGLDGKPALRYLSWKCIYLWSINKYKFNLGVAWLNCISRTIWKGDCQSLTYLGMIPWDDVSSFMVRGGKKINCFTHEHKSLVIYRRHILIFYAFITVVWFTKCLHHCASVCGNSYFDSADNWTWFGSV